MAEKIKNGPRIVPIVSPVLISDASVVVFSTTFAATSRFAESRRVLMGTSFATSRSFSFRVSISRSILFCCLMASASSGDFPSLSWGGGFLLHRATEIPM